MVRKLVAMHGAKKWSFISSHLPGRIGKQCRERYRSRTASVQCYQMLLLLTMCVPLSSDAWKWLVLTDGITTSTPRSASARGRQKRRRSCLLLTQGWATSGPRSPSYLEVAPTTLSRTTGIPACARERRAWDTTRTPAARTKQPRKIPRRRRLRERFARLPLFGYFVLLQNVLIF